MTHRTAALGLAVAILVTSCVATGGAVFAAEAGRDGDAKQSERAYGEWRIQIRPDKMSEYERLIESKGLPLFQKAGGRMVGWWKTLVGDLYEHVTIWEYDNMAAFERAVAKLGVDKQFAEFVAERDPLLAGERNRFLALTDFAAAPTLSDQAPIVVHEVHRVPWQHREEYLKFMENEGLDLVRRHGFDPVGPWVVGVGRKTEITYLFRYQSLRQRDELLAAFARHADARKYHESVDALTEEVTTRVLVPAPFALRAAKARP
jgi:NIPSNAP